MPEKSEPGELVLGPSISASVPMNNRDRGYTFNIVNNASKADEDEYEAQVAEQASCGCTTSLLAPGEQVQSKEALLTRLEFLVDVAYDILLAEDVLAALKKVLAESSDEWQEIVSSPIFERFRRKLLYFQEVGKSMRADQSDWISVFEADSGRQTIKVFMHKDDPNHLEYRVSALIPAKLTHVLSVANEIQFLPTWNTLVTGMPKTVGRRTAHYMLINYQMSLLGGMYKLDVLNEIRRFSSIEGGFLAEYIESAEEDHPSYIPPPSGFKRPNTKIKNIWVAVGESHTLLIQFGSLRTPFSLAKWLVQSLGTVAGKFILGGIVKNSLLASKPGNAWEEPRLKDSLGLYARLDECCAAKASQGRIMKEGGPQGEFDIGQYFERRRISQLDADS